MNSREKALERYKKLKAVGRGFKGKGELTAYDKALRHKKKLPELKPKHHTQTPYKKLSIEEYEKLYPTFND